MTECKILLAMNMSSQTVLSQSQRYYLTATTWSDVQITAATTIDGLKTAEPQVIFSDTSDPDIACNFWAPEIHQVDGRWYVYFSASQCNDDWGVVLPSLRVYVLGGGTENPLSADYELLGRIQPPNYDDGMLDAVRDDPVALFRLYEPN